jgi:alkaline phosphatase
VEGASIDKQDHAANACGQIGEVVAFDHAVQAAMAFARQDGNTSVFVTADHGHTSQIVEAGTVTPGQTVTLETADGAPMTLSYATAEQGKSQQHTGTQVRIAGYGPKAANVVGLTDQTDLHFTIASTLRLYGGGRS